MIPFRIRIGVTGHRHLPDDPLLATRTRQALEESLAALFDEPSRRTLGSLKHTPIAYTLFTALAEGADRLVAREVLRSPAGRIEAVVPLTVADYRESFSAPEAVADFDELLGQARCPVVLRTRPLREEYPETAAREAARQEAYARAGRHVVDACDALIALWDGREARGVGGTGEIVAYAEETGRPVIRIDTSDPAFPIELRASQAAPLNADAAADMDVFNRHLANESSWRRAADKAALDYLGEKAAPGIPEERKALIRKQILPPCVLASEIAVQNRSLFHGAGLWAHLLSVAAVGAVTAAVLVPSLAVAGYALELAMLVVILSLIWFANFRRSRRRWVEHRLLAERLRIAFSFAVCGVEPAPIRVPRHMESLQGPRTWMFRIFEEIRSGFPFVAKGGLGTLADRARFARNQWVKGQIDYHQDRCAKCSWWSGALEYAGMAVFALAIIAAAAHLLAHGDLSGGIEKTLTAAALLLPAAGAAVDGIRSHRDFSRLARRSREIEPVLANLGARIGNARTEEELEAHLREVEDIVALEGQEWFSVMRFVTLEPVP